MKTLSLELPTMYGDHHVLEVRRILLEMPGVEDVYASSSFQVVEVTYDPAKLDADKITAKLEEAGYSGELPVPAEAGEASYAGDGKESFFRHTTAFAQVGKTVGFAQNVGYTGRPLWPCPGMGTIKAMNEGE
jgi:copper chaperone CopZ